MLEIKGITQRFGGVTALEDVSFTLRPNDITGVIGPNGAGKTTLFNIISGIYRQTSGTIFFDGKDISGIPPELLAKRGLVRTFQNVELFTQMTVLENAMVGLHTKSHSGIFACMLKTPGNLAEERRIRKQALQWLEFTGIADLADMKAGNLAFGKGRMLEIARAMALEPRIILMDEPAALTTGKPANLHLLSEKYGNPELLWSSLNMTWNWSWMYAILSWSSIWVVDSQKGLRVKSRKIRQSSQLIWVKGRAKIGNAQGQKYQYLLWAGSCIEKCLSSSE